MISFDLDMTLLDHRTDQITPSALEAIEKLRPKHRIVLATGRDMDNYYSTSYRDIVIILSATYPHLPLKR